LLIVLIAKKSQLSQTTAFAECEQFFMAGLCIAQTRLACNTS